MKKSLEVPIEKEYLWVDSMIVINWVNSNKLLPPFVANRVREIRQNRRLQLCYINTSQNVADVATRPETWENKKLLWVYGPSFLLTTKEIRPHSQENIKNVTLSIGEDLCS